eukprot:CAMPEP_0195528096 /NCGR_PEP_ID=MMETSP0794_2-20130614/30084_1 /TAXON_ID=515487 /ORGANISM="Stephanopyxis turris, Strain CCMP 815" /LENGTH=1188 /DNA_ID=CAMNT_0040659157 /DNA_START=69 /DNA_END=3632 /DNA_ORIENTATION=+
MTEAPPLEREENEKDSVESQNCTNCTIDSIQNSDISKTADAPIEVTANSYPPPHTRPNLAQMVGSSLRSIQSAMTNFSTAHPEGNGPIQFHVTPGDLSKLANERSLAALADVLEKAIGSHYSKPSGATDAPDGVGSIEMGKIGDEESPSDKNRLHSRLRTLCRKIRLSEEDNSFSAQDKTDAAETAAAALTSFVLHSSPERGISNHSEAGLAHRKSYFGQNFIADKKLDSFLKLCWEALKDFVLIMLIVLGIVAIIINTTIDLEPGEACNGCYVEGMAILLAVVIVVLVTAGIDYKKQFTFVKLSRTLDETNLKSVIRGGEVVEVVDADIVVGDILSVNSHNLASIPADCVLLGPAAGNCLKMDEASLTGESKLMSKSPGDVILSGTTAVEGSGKMVVIAVGVNSVAGKIQARVYESREEGEDSEEKLEGDEETPLFTKLERLAKQIGIAGTIAALIAFVGSCIIGFGVSRLPAKEYLVEYFITAVTVLAVAVPEGLPLAVVLALAFSSNRMTKDMNLVKHLDACETMGCATTICTDKTGTLTANKMTARAIYLGNNNFNCTDPKQTLGAMLLASVNMPSVEVLVILANLISINTMSESVLYFDDENKNEVTGSSGNPTECALLQLVHDVDYDYREIRENTKGRAETGKLAKYLGDGKQLNFSSARKMMTWAVPLPDSTGYRIYSKGATEVILSRCTSQMTASAATEPLSQETLQSIIEITEQYARRGMRCLSLAYRDLPNGVDFDQLSDAGDLNADGTPALACETSLIFVALVGIEDPLRPEVPEAIEKCYEAGIDVRMVTGDSPNTAVSIASQAGILREEHFVHEEGKGKPEMVASNLKENVLMEGKTFRAKVYRNVDDDDDEEKKEFDQVAFDKIWPYLRVLARSSPDDKLTLAHGLNQSTLFADKDKCKEILKLHNIKVFPDRQVIAMTGDGTNDAPALKRADIGFAMGISGTQIAKDAADIILLDDNFASIVTAAKWGRNVYASIQKFLQFQLTVNIAAVTIALTGAFYVQKSPLAAIQLLWVNLLMDALASLALASEPPIDALLKKSPVNRTDTIITKRMWANMLGQAIYQIITIMVLLFRPDLLGVLPGHLVEKKDGLGPGTGKSNSRHYTIIFNAFVWMQLFNEINSRNLKGEVNVFRGIHKNCIFCSILLVTAILQVIMVEFGYKVMHVVEGGLNRRDW